MTVKSFIRRYVLTNSSREYLRRYNEAFGADTKPGMVVLDAGAGEQPYRDLFRDCQYESADFEMVDKPYVKSTYVCDLAKIPVEDARFDRIVFNQVLEHIPEPGIVLAELNRVLKPGGKMICTCPLYYEEHEKPYDYYRYTQFALRLLFENAGFEIERVDWMEGYFGAIGYQFQGMAQNLPLAPGRYMRATWWPVIFWPLVVMVKLSAGILTGVFYRLDLACKITDRGYPKNYVVLARKAG
jgi:SAM-dependent methyltransferase